MSPASQSAAAPVTVPVAHPHPPPTLLQTGTSSHPNGPNGPNGPNATGRTAAQMTSASPATAGTADPGVSGQTSASPRPVVKMKRTGHQGPFPVSSFPSFPSPLGSRVGPKPSLQTPTKPKAASSSLLFPPATRNRPPSHARQSHVGLPNSVAASLSSSLRLSSSASPSPDLDPQAFSSRPSIGSAHPYRPMDHAGRRPSGSRREISPDSSRLSSSNKSPSPKPAQQPLPSSNASLDRNTPRASHRGTSAFRIASSPFRSSGRTAPKPEPQAEQTLVAIPSGPSAVAPSINPKTNKVYSSADAIDDGNYKHYLQVDDPSETDSNTRGALIPQNYRKSDDAEYPWICPVRSCRSKHAVLSGLGTHFTSTHREKCFNDNLDGTLTDLGEYHAVGDNPSNQPIIVSKRPMTLNESPFAPAWRREKHRPVVVPPRRKLRSRSTTSLLGSSDTSSLPEVESSSSDSEAGVDKRRIFRMANPDRAYNQWIDPGNGSRQTMSGALLPDDYTKHTSIPDRPFICPIRSCRHLHKNISDLSIHWERAHLGRYLNDNLDGTFTVIGDRQKLHKPAVVISRTPNDSDPIVAAKYPRYTTGKNSVWVDLHEENTVIDQNTGVSDINSGSRITRNVPPKSASSQPRIKEPRPTAPPPQIGTKEAQGRFEDIANVSEPTSPMPETIRSDVGIVNTRSGRPYASWVDLETGAVKPINCAVVPDGYELLTDEHPTRPFVCPIRTCRRLCRALHGLVAHFALTHPKDVLNDNCDGTLSIVGQGKSCIVVSQNPLGPDEPMVDPTFPEYSKAFYERELAKHHSRSTPSTRPTLTDNSVLEADDEFEDADGPDNAPELPSPKPPAKKDVVRSSDGADPQGPWSFLCAELDKEYPLILTGCTEVLLQLPPARSLDLRRPLKKDLDPRQLDATLIQLVGEEFPKAPCTQCRKGTGPFYSCVRAPVPIAEQLHPHLKSRKLACANCLFTKLAHSCSVKYSGVRYNSGAWSLPGAKLAAAPKSSDPRPPSFSHQLNEEIPETSSSEEDYSETRNLLKRRRSARAHHVAEEPDPKRRVVTMRVQPDKLGVTTSAPASAPRPRVPAQAPVSGAVIIGVNPATTQDVLDMEDWEMEEGQIPAADASTSGQNLATHISIGQTVQLFTDVSLSTQVISSSGAFSFTPDGNKTRVCVIIGGKLKVQVGDEKEFVIGQRGMFRISPGVKCLVLNTTYIDAMLQVTTMTGPGQQ
ncbi:hypothetical protein B0T18DRAFT_170317 [Schizothecium vesticola]|uniref:C2H2-type domain-containing protein n=1 Tax=Schizothecium vesticola TaxID=314040 RepID=A0AA40K1S4_9PEZI|nr:hypothetical protein B0T18DRAFT_170317 [Schizothecium vesticola]